MRKFFCVFVALFFAGLCFALEIGEPAYFEEDGGGFWWTLIEKSEFDERGNQTYFCDEKIERRCEYDEAGNLVVEKIGDVEIVRKYDSAGRKIYESRSESHYKSKKETFYEYDAVGNLVFEKNPYRRFVDFYEYDEKNRLIRQIHRGPGDGEMSGNWEKNIEYDEAGRPIESEKEYDEAGNLVRDGETYYEYDDKGRKIREKYVNRWDGYMREFDKRGNMTRERFVMTWDDNGWVRHSRIEEGVGEYEYDENGSVVYAIVDRIDTPQKSDKSFSRERYEYIYRNEYDEKGRRVAVFRRAPHRSDRFPMIDVEYGITVTRPLKKGGECIFEVKTEKKAVALFFGGEMLPLKYDKYKYVFSLSAKIPQNAEKVSIGVADSETGRYEIIVEYELLD